MQINVDAERMISNSGAGRSPTISYVVWLGELFLSDYAYVLRQDPATDA